MLTSKSAIGDILAAVFLLALVYLLAKPNSAAASAISMFASAMTALVQTVTTL